MPTGSRCLRISALGRPDCHIDNGDRAYQLSQRHSDILAVLAEHPEGVSGDQLAVAVYPDYVGSSTMRAEMTRMRALLGDWALESRPYRLRVPIECDWLAVRAKLAQGDVRSAMNLYRVRCCPPQKPPASSNSAIDFTTSSAPPFSPKASST